MADLSGQQRRLLWPMRSSSSVSRLAMAAAARSDAASAMKPAAAGDAVVCVELVWSEAAGSDSSHAHMVAHKDTG